MSSYDYRPMATDSAWKAAEPRRGQATFEPAVSVHSIKREASLYEPYVPPRSTWWDNLQKWWRS